MNRRLVSRGMTLGLLLLALTCEMLAAADQRPLALDGLDPVLLTSGREVAGQEDLTAQDGQYTYRFSSPATLAKFQADPDRFGVQNTSCPVSPGAHTDPAIFTVHDGRLYTFASKGCVREFTEDPEFYLNPPTFETRNVAILVFDGVELLDFAGPGEVFASAAHGRAFQTYTVSETTDEITSQGFVAVKPEYSIENAPKPDILIIPGGSVGGLIGNQKMMDWIRSSAADAITMSVCSGAFVLARAGLLDGKEATTHHSAIDQLADAATNIVVHADRRWVDNGGVITSAGVSAGIDASLHLVSRLLGEKLALRTARYMEYAWSQGDEAKGTVTRAAQD